VSIKAKRVVPDSRTILFLIPRSPPFPNTCLKNRFAR
jgi:hypothetical protein